MSVATVSRKGKTFVKNYEHRTYGPYAVPISRKDYVKLQLGMKNGSINQIVRAFLEHIGSEYFIVQTHQHGQKYIVRLFTEVKPDDGPIEWAENTQLHLAMYELMSEYLWHVQNTALDRFNAEQAQRFADQLARDAAIDAKYLTDPELLEDIRVGPWTPEAIV